MPYCTRCGKKIEEGERCSCQKNVIDFDAALQNKNPVNQFFGLRESSRDPKVRYERDMKIIPENVSPDEGEIPIRQYDLCTLRSRIKFMRAEGRLQVTNKRVIFRAKGVSLTGPTVVQHEFSIAELAGFQISRNFRFSILDLLLILLLSGFCGAIGWQLAFRGVFSETPVILGILQYLFGLVALAFTFFLGERYVAKTCLAAFAVTTMGATILGANVSRTVAILLLIPALVALIQKIASDILFSFKPNLDFQVCSKMGSGVLHLRCERGGFAGLTPMIEAVFTGYNEVLPTEQTNKAIREIGAMISDIQKLGDLAVEKWKED